MCAASARGERGDLKVRIALIQQHVGADRGANLRRGLAAAEQAAADGARLIAFPELAFTPFYPRHRACGPPPLELAEEIPGPDHQRVCRARAAAQDRGRAQPLRA